MAAAAVTVASVLVLPSAAQAVGCNTPTAAAATNGKSSNVTYVEPGSGTAVHGNTGEAKTESTDQTCGGGGGAAQVPSWWKYCEFQQYTTEELLEVRSGSPGSVVDGLDTGAEADNGWVVQYCPGNPSEVPAGLSWYDSAAGLLFAWRVGDAAPPGLMTWLRWEALAQATLPIEVGTTWATGDADMPMITQADVWLWLPDEQKTPIVSSVSTADYEELAWLTPPYTSTVTLDPVRVRWDGGGDSATCTPAQMKPYDKSASYFDQQTDCSIVYTSDADGQSITVQGFWHATYTCSPGCTGADLGEVSSVPYTRPVEVDEIQAINVGASG